MRAVDELWPLTLHYPRAPQPLATLDHPDQLPGRVGREVLRGLAETRPTVQLDASRMHQYQRPGASGWRYLDRLRSHLWTSAPDRDLLKEIG